MLQKLELEEVEYKQKIEAKTNSMKMLAQSFERFDPNNDILQ